MSVVHVGESSPGVQSLQRHTLCSSALDFVHAETVPSCAALPRKSASHCRRHSQGLIPCAATLVAVKTVPSDTLNARVYQNLAFITLVPVQRGRPLAEEAGDGYERPVPDKTPTLLCEGVGPCAARLRLRHLTATTACHIQTILDQNDGCCGS
jgi:hypothetical protein